MQQLTTPFAHASQVKLTLSFYQVATLIPEVYIVQMPAQVHGVLEFFSLAIEIDAWNLHMSCCPWQPPNHGTRLRRLMPLGRTLRRW